MEIFRHYQHIFAGLNVIYWPWVWLQLRQVWRYSTRTGRQVVLNFDTRGRMSIVAIADAPEDTQSYQYTAPPTPIWQRANIMMDMPAFVAGFATSFVPYDNTPPLAPPAAMRRDINRALIIPPWPQPHSE